MSGVLLREVYQAEGTVHEIGTVGQCGVCREPVSKG